MSEPSNTASDLESPNRASRSGRVRTGSTARFWVGIPALFATTVVLLLALWAVVLPAAMGWKPVAIVSGSMYPLIKPGDIVVAAPTDGTQLEPGTVIVFKDPVFEGLISHRIYSINDDGTYTTKGDANASKDSTPISPDSVVGVGRLLVPYIGNVPYWKSSGQTRNLALAIAAWGMLLMASRWGLLERYNPWSFGSEPLTVSGPRGRHRAVKPRKPRLLVTSISAIISLTLVLGIALSAAAISTTHSNAGNQFGASTFLPPANLQVSASCASSTPIGFRGATTANGQSTAITLTKPAGTVAGDTMLAHIVQRWGYTMTAPAGWSLVRQSVTSPYSSLFVKIAGSSEPSSYTWTIPSSQDRYAAGLGTWTNVDTVTPIDAHGGQSGTGNSIVAPSITTTMANDMLVAFWSITDDKGVSIPGSTTLRWEVNSNSSGASDQQVQSTTASELSPVAGPTGSRTATASTRKPQNNVGQMVALRPGGTSAPAVTASWTATPSTFATGYKLQRWLGAVQQNEQTLTPRSTTNATDATVTGGQTYTYKLFAFFGAWTSPQITASVTTPSC